MSFPGEWRLRGVQTERPALTGIAMAERYRAWVGPGLAVGFDDAVLVAISLSGCGVCDGGASKRDAPPVTCKRTHGRLL